MVITQLLSARDLLTLTPAQLESIDTIIEAEIVKSDEIMQLLKQKLEKDYLPVIRELHGHGK
jgi:hypothetical protein